MKKGLFLLAGMAMAASSAFAAATTLYGFGGEPIGKGWTPNVGNELTSTAPGVFTWEGTVESNCYFAFVEQLGTTTSDWATPNATRYSPASKDFPINGAGEYEMSYGVDTSWKLAPGEYKFEINTNTNVLKVSILGEVEITTTYALHGQFNGLTDLDWENINLTAVNDDKWTATFTPTVTGGGFGVKELINGGDGGWFANGVTFDSSNTTYVLDGSIKGNCTFGFPANSVCTATFIPSTKTLTITSEGGGEINPPVGNDYPEMYLVGTMTGWKKDAAYKMTTTDGITYTFTTDLTASDEFKFNGGDWNIRNLGLETKNLNLADGTFNLVSGLQSKDIGLTKGGHITLTLVQENDFASAKLTVTGQGVEGPDDPDPVVDYTTWYFNVPFSQNDWTDNGVTFSAEGKATLENLEIGTGMFYIKVWNGKNDIAYGTGSEVSLGTTTLPSGLAEAAMTIEGATEDSTYNVSFDVTTGEMTLTLGTPTGVAEIEAANDEATYFNLQGMRVANPENGLFIKVVNGKSTKVLLNK